jgi:hypothetical protein
LPAAEEHPPELPGSPSFGACESQRSRPWSWDIDGGGKVLKYKLRDRYAGHYAGGQA